MTEREYNQKEKFEIEDRLSKVKSYINSIIIPEMDDDFFERTGTDKKSTKVNRIYYAGGTLCMDVICGKEEALFILNISDETFTTIVNGKQTRRLMPIRHLWLAFTIYKEVKGFTEYYKNCYDKSCIRQLYGVMMNRHETGYPMSTIETIEDYIGDGAKQIDFAKIGLTVFD